MALCGQAWEPLAEMFSGVPSRSDSSVPFMGVTISGELSWIVTLHDWRFLDLLPKLRSFGSGLKGKNGSLLRSSLYFRLLYSVHNGVHWECGLLQKTGATGWPNCQGMATRGRALRGHKLELLTKGLRAPGAGAAAAQGFLPVAHRCCPLAKGASSIKASKHILPNSSHSEFLPAVCVLVCCPALLLGALFHAGAELLIISGYWISDVTFSGFGFLLLFFLDLHKQCRLCPVALTQLQSLVWASDNVDPHFLGIRWQQHQQVSEDYSPTSGPAFCLPRRLDSTKSPLIMVLNLNSFS